MADFFLHLKGVIVLGFAGVFLVYGCKKNDDKTCMCTHTYNPVCAGVTQYRNPCMASCAGHDADDIRLLLTAEEIASGILISVDCSFK